MTQKISGHIQMYAVLKDADGKHYVEPYVSITDPTPEGALHAFLDKGEAQKKADQLNKKK